MDLNKIYYDVDGNAHNILEMMKEEPGWAANRVQIGEKAIKDSAELRAQLARLTTYIESIIDTDIQTISSKTALLSTLEDLPNQAKADAEVLRYAEEEANLHKVGVDASGEVSTIVCNCPLCNAVRAAKESKYV